ncbi:CLAVATA3/ESR (CLE)-related protein 44 [Lycium ferocissimum]|uniref:CLAVATA3/ESR (CLE)-related protein 44 n=1 Tax=Lycium ferocissimum TaxID=112874 RepID=UPI0028168493|nr:CLAVATA3/ESR (CLE)-related protein 44 [Lycium ferocissimum]
MATLRKSEISTFNSYSLIFFLTLFFLFLIVVQSSSDDDVNPFKPSSQNSDHSSSSTATINMNSRKIPRNSHTSSSSSSSSRDGTHRQFEASEHAVPSGPNPTSNRLTTSDYLLVNAYVLGINLLLHEEDIPSQTPIVDL